MKNKLICFSMLLTMSMVVFTSCSDETKNGSGDFSKVRIKGAKTLFIGASTSNGVKAQFAKASSSVNDGLLMKQMPDGKIEPVYFILSNGDSLTCNTEKVIPLNNEWILLSGNYSTTLETYKYLFVNKNSESILGVPSGSNFTFYSSNLKGYRDVFFDESGAIYLPTSDNLYKFNLKALGKVTAEKYLPDGEFSYDATYLVSKEGICFYAQNYDYAEYPSYRFKLPSGKIVRMSEDFVLNNYKSDYVSNSFIYSRRGDIQLFTDKDGKMYILTIFANLTYNYSFAIYRIDLGNNQLQYTKVAEKIVPKTVSKMNGGIPFVSELIVNPKRGTVMAGFHSSYNDTDVGIFEFDGSSIQYIFTQNSYNHITNFTANYLVDTYNNKALNLNDYTEININSDSRYEIKGYSFSRYSDNYSCKALEYNSGKIGILDCSVKTGILGFTPVSNGENITLSRIN